MADDPRRLPLGGEERETVRHIMGWHERNGEILERFAELVRAGKTLRNIAVTMVAIGAGVGWAVKQGWFG